MKMLGLMRATKPQGYTLIEILIVLFIVSIVTTVGLLSIRHNDQQQLEVFANELTQVLSLAGEKALLEPRVLGLSINDGVMQFASLQEKDSKQVWQPLIEPSFSQINVPSHLELKLEPGKETANTQKTTNLNPQIIISTNGDITPFTIYLGKKGESPSYVITSDANGLVTSKQIS